MDSIADDLLLGAGAIAKFLRGRDTEKTRRWVYHRHEKRILPTWRDGDQIVCTKTLLRQHYATPRLEPAE